MNPSDYSITRAMVRRASNPAASPFFKGAIAVVLCGLVSLFMSCLSSSDSGIPGAAIVKRVPALSDSSAEKISPVVTGLADGRILAAWASHVPELGKAWKTEWRFFDEKGEVTAEGFDWVPLPGKIRKTVADAGTEAGAVIASIVEFDPGQPPEVYVHEFRKGEPQLDPGIISLPGATSIGEIAVLELDKADFALAARGSYLHRPVIWAGRFDRAGAPAGEVSTYFPGDSAYPITQLLISPIKAGGWACYWVEERSKPPLSVVGQAFSEDGKPAGLPHRTGISCAGAPVFGVYPLLPYGDGRVLVLPMGNEPSCAYTVGPEGDSLKHPDLADLNTLRPMTLGKPGTNSFIALAGRHPNPSTEIDLLDSALTVVQRRSFPKGSGQELAVTRTASGHIALLTLQAPYRSNSRFGFMLMDPHWE